MSEPAVTAIVVTYDSTATIGDALTALHPAHERGLLEALVVDNDSSDDTVALVQRDHAWVRLIHSGGNLGFGRANNLGLEVVTTPYVLLLNPDACLTEADLERLLAFLDQNPSAGIVGPAIRNADGRPQTAHPFPTPTRVLREALGRSHRDDAPIPTSPGAATGRVDWLCGAALLLRKSVLDELAGFDPRFFLYFEETDLCYRAQRAGHETWLVGDATAQHVAHSSARGTDHRLYHGCIAEHYFRSRYYYLVKHHGRAAATATELLGVAITALRAAVRWLRRRPNLDELVVRLQAPYLRTPR